MKNRLIFTIVGIIILILLVTTPLVSAFQFDNIKGNLERGVGISEYGRIEIRNSMFGFEWFQLDKIMGLELKENTEVCPLTGCSANTTIIMYEDGKLIDNIKFIDLETGERANIKNYDIYVNGDLYNGEEVSGHSKGVIYDVELRGKLNPFQKVDWQIKSAGTDWIDDWATWTNALNVGLVAYFKFDVGNTESVFDEPVTNTSGNTSRNTTDKIIVASAQFNGSTKFSLRDDRYDFSANDESSVCFWLYWDNSVSVVSDRIFSSNDTSQGWDLQVSTDNIVYPGTGVCGYNPSNINFVDNNTWTFICGTCNTSTMRWYKNGTLDKEATGVFTILPHTEISIGGNAQGTIYEFGGNLDEFGLWNRTLTPTEVSDLYNSGAGISYTITSLAILNSPVDNYNTTNKNITFNCTGITSPGRNITNVSLYHNESGTWTLNQTNSTSHETNSTSIFNVLFQDIESIEWNCYSCDNTSICGYAINNRTVNIRAFVIGNENYSQITTEGNVEPFYINITTAGLGINSANLTYNNTNYPAMFIQSGYEFYISKTINIPQVSSSRNLTFNWNFELSDSSTISTDSHNQSVLSLNMDNCSTYTYTLFNISLKDEEDQSELAGGPQNTSIKLDFIISTLNDIKIANYSTFFYLVNPASVCLESELNQGSLRLDGIIEYSSLGRFTEFYHFQNYFLDETTTDLNISLYNLNSSNGQEFKITYKDSNFVPVEGAILDIQRKYVDEGVFKTTERPKTGTEGYTMGHLVINDVIYNILVYKEGNILASFNDLVADCQNPSLSNCNINLNSYGSSVLPKSFVTVNDLSFTLTYNKTTREIESVFTILSGATSSINLDVNLFDSLGSTSVCNNTLHASGGTVSCTVPLSFGNSTVVAKLNKNGELIGQSVIRITPNPSDIYGSSLIFIALFAFILIIGIGISDNPMIMGVVLIIGVIILTALNIIYTPSLIGVGATILWFIVAVIIILIKGSSRQ